MIKIVIGGQLNKRENETLVKTSGKDQVEIEVMGDLEAAMALKNGQVDYYFGSCQTGGGGALAMAIAMNGLDQCVTVAGVGTMISDEAMRQAVIQGKKAFGFVPEAAHSVIPVLVSAILENQKGL